MGIACPSCAHLIAGDADGRVPPWCPKCGTDLKPRAAAPQAAPTATASDAVGGESPVGPAVDDWHPLPGRASLPRPAPASRALRQAAIGAMVGAVALPALLRQYVPPSPTAGGLDMNQVWLAAICGGAGALLGRLLGRAFDGQSEVA